MNIKLQNQYIQLELKNKDKFLRNEIDIDTQWNKPIFGITLQIELNDLVKTNIEAYQKNLTALEQNNLLILTRKYHHISFQQVVFWGDIYEKSNEDTWNTVACAFTQSFKAQDNICQSFQITFSKLIATTGGIIWCAYDDHDEMNTLRNTLQKELPFPKGTTKQNYIIHTTVARFRHKLHDPLKVMNFINNSNESQTMLVDNINLCKERIYPSLQRKTIATIRLI